jgi:ATP-dependent Clp protease ATP-binding subunit ClpA
VLESLDITVEEVRFQIVRIVGHGDEATTGQIPFTPRATKVLELALREALSLGHDYIGTEHMLLGLVRENEGVAARILRDFDADAERVRSEVLRMLSRPGGRGSGGEHVETSPPDETDVGFRVTTGRVGRMPRRVTESLQPDDRRWFLMLGFALFGVASSIGVFVGWLIWG